VRRAAVALLDALRVKPAVKRLLRSARTLGVPTGEPRVLRVLPHDPAAFTQGLHVHDGVLYESTGLVGQSSLRVIDRETGAILRMIAVEDGFAEGIAVLGDRLVQLAWRSQRALVYRLPDLVPVGRYDYAGEGWGMTATAEQYLTSDGSDEITYRNRNFDRVRSLKVRVNGLPLRGINDLAWAHGRIYCNVLHDSRIYEISEASGRVARVFDCSHLARTAASPGPASVMNGIAYDRRTDTFFVTGKRWCSLFQVRLDDDASGIRRIPAQRRSERDTALRARGRCG
jgi:glutamine cyclotransferase